MSLVGLGFTTSDASTGKRLQCDVTIYGGNDLNSRGATDSKEAFAFTNVGSGSGHIVISRKGYITRDIPCKFPIQANIDFPMIPDGSPIDNELHLEVKGNDFVDKNGNPTCYNGIDQFIAFRMWLDNRINELDTLIQESHEFRFNWWRVFFQGSKQQNTIFDLNPNESNYYNQVRLFADYLNKNGIGLLAEIYVDNQDVQSPLSHWTRMADLLRGSITILSGGNEWPKNGFDPQSLSHPNMICSRGSSTADDVTPQNGFTCASFHQRTDYSATIRDAVASSTFMNENGYTVLMMDEPTRFNLDGTNKSNYPDSKRLAFRLASCYRAMWSLVIFHNQSGQRGMLLTPELRIIAKEWMRGMI